MIALKVNNKRRTINEDDEIKKNVITSELIIMSRNVTQFRIY